MESAAGGSGGNTQGLNVMTTEASASPIPHSPFVRPDDDLYRGAQLS